MPGFGPIVIHKTGPFRLHFFHEGDKKPFPIGVLIVAEVFSVQFGLLGMHDHPGLQVVDPEIIVLIVAQILNHQQGLLLGLLLGKGPGLRLFAIVIQHPPGGLDHMPGL